MSVSGLILLGVFQTVQENGSVLHLHLDSLVPSLKDCSYLIKQYEVIWGQGSPSNHLYISGEPVCVPGSGFIHRTGVKTRNHNSCKVDMLSSI